MGAVPRPIHGRSARVLGPRPAPTHHPMQSAGRLNRLERAPPCRRAVRRAHFLGTEIRASAACLPAVRHMRPSQAACVQLHEREVERCPQAPQLASQSPGSFRQSDALFHLTVAVNTSSISKLVRQPGAAVWLSRLSVQTGCETPSCETNPR